MLTDSEKDMVLAGGDASPVKVSDGFAILVPIANDDWEIHVLEAEAEAVEHGRMYWGVGFGTIPNGTPDSP